MNEWQQHLDAAIDRQFDGMVELRRQLHEHPEVSGEEFETSKLLADRLERIGLDPQLGTDGRGVIVDVGCAADGQLFAIRGDIDALRIQDRKSVQYCSKKPGVMHACGHDAHTAMVFGATAALEELRSSNTVTSLAAPLRTRAIFQPAEETCEGALQMIDAGAMEGVGALIATHVDPKRQVGTIGIRPGVMTAYCDHMRVVVRGRGGHGARPHETRDPIAAAAQLIQSLYAQVPRSIDSQDSVVLSIGQILGGHNGNVIPDSVTLNGTLRTLSVASREQAANCARRIANATSAATETMIDIEFVGGADAVVNCPALTQLIVQTGNRCSDVVDVKTMARPSMGGEDFAFYGAHVPTAMFRLGIVSDACGGAGLHTPNFDLDEQALKIGARIMAHAAVAWCAQTSDKNGEIVNS